MELLFDVLTFPVRILLYGAGIFALIVLVWGLLTLPELWHEMDDEDEE